MAKINYLKLIASIIICLGIGSFGGFATASSVSTWYVTLNKPFFNPPSWLFGPVWTLLYILMGISLYLVWSKKLKPNVQKKALGLFGIQLILNFFWSLIFFGLRNPLLAFVEIVLLWVSILFTIIYFWRVSKPAASLLIPYILWVSFASVLNLAIVVLN